MEVSVAIQEVYTSLYEKYFKKGVMSFIGAGVLWRFLRSISKLSLEEDV